MNQSSVTTQAGQRVPLAPSEGWLTLGLVLLLCASLAWSLDDAMLVLGRDSATDFLLWTAVGGVLAGFVGAKVGWGRMRTYLVGAAFAALITPLLVGWVIIRTGHRSTTSIRRRRRRVSGHGTTSSGYGTCRHPNTATT